MPRITYVEKNFRPDSLRLIKAADALCRDYARQGYVFTLRQLYYQLVARNIIPNKATAYDNLGALLSDARDAGLIDWDHLEDRTRNVEENPHWTDPSNAVRAIAQQYRIDLWEPQQWRPWVWIEKQALSGVIDSICRANDVPYLACRGYMSQSEMWAAAERIIHLNDAPNSEGVNPTVAIIYLGDHDPSGINMTEDITKRLGRYGAEPGRGGFCKIDRIALTMDQVQQYGLPPNPAKQTDSRFADYEARFGTDESWELDALTTAQINTLVQTAIDKYRDPTLWKQKVAQQEGERIELTAASTHWSATRSWFGANGMLVGLDVRGPHVHEHVPTEDDPTDLDTEDEEETEDYDQDHLDAIILLLRLEQGTEGCTLTYITSELEAMGTGTFSATSQVAPMLAQLERDGRAYMEESRGRAYWFTKS